MPWGPPKPEDWAYSEKQTQISSSQILEIMVCKGVKPISLQLRKKRAVLEPQLPSPGSQERWLISDNWL